MKNNKKIKIKKIIISLLIFIFIFSLLLWSVPIFGAEKSNSEKFSLPEYFITKSSDIEMIEPKIIPDSPIYFIKIAGEWIGNIFSFGDINKAENKLILSSERLLEARQLVFKNSPKEKISKAIERYQKENDEFQFYFSKAVSIRPTDILSKNMPKKIINHFIFGQKILAEISMIENNITIRKTIDNIINKNSDFIISSLSRFSGENEIFNILDNIFSETNDFNNKFSYLRNLESIIELEISLDKLSVKKESSFYILKSKTIGRVLGEIMNDKENDYQNLIVVPFANPINKRVAILELRRESNMEGLFDGILGNLSFDVSDEELESCFNEFSIELDKKIISLDSEMLFSTKFHQTLSSLIREIKDRLALSQEKKDDNELEKSCFLLQEANVLSNFALKELFYSENNIAGNNFSDYLKKSIDEIKEKIDLENQEYIRLSDIFKEIGEHFEIMNKSLGEENWDRFFSESSKFWAGQNNFQFLLRKKEDLKNLLGLEAKENFSVWCWERRGIMFEDLSIWPQCELPNNEILSLEIWANLESN